MPTDPPPRLPGAGRDPSEPDRHPGEGRDPSEPPATGQTLTPAQFLADALAAAGLIPKAVAPGIVTYSLKSKAADHALHDPEKRRPGYIPKPERRDVVREDGPLPTTKDKEERRMRRLRPGLW